MNIMGIDPGITGGIVVLDENQKVLAKHAMPAIITKKQTTSTKTGKTTTKTTTQLDLKVIAQILEEWADYVDMVYLEKVAAMPNQGVSSVFKFGRVYGALEGMVTAFKMPMTLVTPAQWCKELHKGVSASMQPKDKSRVVIGRLFPKVDLRATERSKKPHEGMVDALLISEYGRRLLTSQA